MDQADKNLQSEIPAERAGAIAPASGADADIRTLLRENIELTKKLAADVHSIRHYFTGKKIWGWFWAIIIILSFVWSAIYLPPLVQQLMATVNKASGQINSASQLQDNVNLNNLNLNNIIKH